MLFKDIIGHNDVKKRLLQSVKDKRISHAQLFLGPEGCGSLSLAIAYAQYINCTQPTENDSCGVCPSCFKFSKLVHPDLHFVFPVATTSKVKTNPVSNNFLTEWREAVLQFPYMNLTQWYKHIGVENKQGGIQKNESEEVIKKLNLKTYEGAYKIMIIWMAEKMNETCANKLLKIIEEPSPNTLFILISESTEAILQTILSRTQMVKIPKIDSISLANYLKEQPQIAAEDINTLVHVSNGDMNKLKILLEGDANNTENFELFTSLMRLCYTKNIIEVQNVIEILYSFGRERQKNFLEYALRMIRENFILNKKADSIVYLFKEEALFSQKFSPFINDKNIMTITKELNEAHYHIERNGNAKIIFFDLALKLTIALKA